jgi:hypothetical protein
MELVEGAFCACATPLKASNPVMKQAERDRTHEDSERACLGATSQIPTVFMSSVCPRVLAFAMRYRTDAHTGRRIFLGDGPAMVHSLTLQRAAQVVRRRP